MVPGMCHLGTLKLQHRQATGVRRAEAREGVRCGVIGASVMDWNTLTTVATQFRGRHEYGGCTVSR